MDAVAKKVRGRTRVDDCRSRVQQVAWVRGFKAVHCSDDPNTRYNPHVQLTTPLKLHTAPKLTRKLDFGWTILVGDLIPSDKGILLPLIGLASRPAASRVATCHVIISGG